MSEVVDIENHSKKLTDRETEEKRKFNATFKVNTVKVNNLQKKKFIFCIGKSIHGEAILLSYLLAKIKRKNSITMMVQNGPSYSCCLGIIKLDPDSSRGVSG